jgi:archaellum component FlaC
MVAVERTVTQIIEAYQQDSRIVIKKTGDEEIFEAQKYHAKLDDTYISSPEAVFRKIHSFIVGHGAQCTLDQLGELNRIVLNKINQINARTTGLFAIILMFFNKSLRQRLMSEHRALTQLRTTLLAELNTNGVRPLLSSDSSSASGTLHHVPPKQNDSIPPPPPGGPPPAPPAPALPGGPPAAKTSAFRSLRPNPSPVLDDEPPLAPIPNDRLPTPEEVTAFEDYIEAMTKFWGEIKTHSIRLDKIKTQKNDVNEKIENIRNKIDKSERGIKALSSQTSEDVIFLRADKTGQVMMPLITEQGLKKFPNQESQEPSQSSPQTDRQSTPPPAGNPGTLTPPSSPVITNSNYSGDHPPNRISKRSFKNLASRLVLRRTSDSSPKAPSSHRQFTITSLLEIYRNVIRLCEVKLIKYKERLEGLDKEYEKIEESFKSRSLTDICALLEQKESYIESCRKFIADRKAMQAGTLTRKPSTAVATRPKGSITQTEAELILAEIDKFRKNPSNHAIALQIQQLEHMGHKEIMKQFNQLFIAHLN